MTDSSVRDTLAAIDGKLTELIDLVVSLGQLQNVMAHRVAYIIQVLKENDMLITDADVAAITAAFTQAETDVATAYGAIVADAQNAAAELASAGTPFDTAPVLAAIATVVSNAQALQAQVAGILPSPVAPPAV